MNFTKSFKRVLITGGCGFIGGALVKRILNETNSKVFNIDKLGYASDKEMFSQYFDIDRYQFLKVDLFNIEDTKKAINFIDPDIIFHLAAESHVDRSITFPRIFLESNVIGTFNLLEAIMPHWDKLPADRKEFFKLIHVSTDEVFGSLGQNGFFSEESPYNPSSPYSATKASSDLIVKSWYKTYGLPSIITNSSNNFGPRQLPEKLIPLIIFNAISNKSIPIYGDGKNVRDWIYVEDHINALLKIALNGKVGEAYCIGGGNQRSNEEIFESICDLLDLNIKSNSPHNRLKVYVEDRLGHDRRYAIDYKKLKKELEWSPKYDFNQALSFTVKWYLNNIDWFGKFKEI
ncbi:dTDP-glucose 4,6-dehydratase [Prochlorococcus sp. MIT 0916]|uniref:dTDP-glucose 4,6-dehydratase n=1 Tax=Prochlorococcus sp. MIT 0916 TaxID=3082521 RepID=UPI0039B55DC8